MDTITAYFYHGETSLRTESYGAMLHDIEIKDCYTEKVELRGYNSGVFLKIKSGKSESFSLFSRWNKKVTDLKDKVMAFRCEFLSNTYMPMYGVNTGILWRSWDSINMDIYFNENGEITKIVDLRKPEAFISQFREGWADELCKANVLKYKENSRESIAYYLGKKLCKVLEIFDISDDEIIKQLGTKIEFVNQ